MMSQRAKGLFAGLFVVWIFFTLGSFFTVQKPFSAANALAIGQSLLNLLVAGWLMLVGLGLGSLLLQHFLPLDLSLAERFVFGTGLGLGAMGLLILGLGLIGLFQPLVAYGITVALSIIVVPQLRAFFRQLFRWRPVNLPNRLTTLYLLLIGLFALLLALLPPTDWDGLFYHLTGPKLYLQAGRITGGFDVPHFNFPSLMEMLFAWAMLLRGDIAAKLLHTGFGLLLVGLVYLTTRRFLGQKAAWPAVVILAGMPMLGTLAAWAYNDLALAFYQLAAIYAIINYQLAISNEQLAMNKSPISNPSTTLRTSLQSLIENPKPVLSLAEVSKIQNRRWLILGGLFAGLAMGLKYTSFVTPLVISGLILWRTCWVSRITPSNRWWPASRFAGISNLAIFSLVALLIALPWYVKNWVFTGNPVYPFLSDLLGGQYWDSFRAEWYASAGTGIGWRPGTLLTLPWLLTLGVRDVNFWDGRTGPLLLLFLPLILFYSLFHNHYNASQSKIQNPKSKIANVLLIYVLAHFAFWTLGVIWSRSLWQSRLLLPGLVGLAPLAGWVWVKLPQFDLSKFSVSRFVNIAVGLALVLTIVDVGLLTLKINPAPYVVGLESRDEYLTRRLGAHYAAMQQINQQLPPNARVVFLWEPRSYYCRLDCQPDSILDRFPHLVYQYRSTEAIAQAWQKAGATHVLIHRSGLDFLLQEQPEMIDVDTLQSLENLYLQQIFDVAGVYQVYVLQE